MSRGPFRLRRFRWWDVEQVTAIERAVFGPTAWTAEQFWSELAQRDTRWYAVAEVDEPGGGAAGKAGALAGYAGLLVSGAESDVLTLAVAPFARRRGLGRTLLEALLAEAAARRATSTMLEVRADNPAALALYRRYGFERIAVRRGYYQPGDVDAWVMRLRPLRVPTLAP